MYSEERMLGVIIGIMVGAVIVALLLRFFNRDKKLRTEYDEMQKQIRGTAYKYAFFVVLIFEGVLLVLSMAKEIPAKPSVIHFMAIFLGVTVQVSYCIWKGAYIGMNTNVKRFVICMTVVSLFNFWVSYMSWRNGELLTGGIIQEPAINLLCGLMFAVMGVVALMRKMTDREEDA